MLCPKCHHPNPPSQLLCACCQQTLRHAKLRVVDHSGKELHFDLNYQDFTIGRQAGNDLVLAEEGVSRCHARLCFVAGAYLVEDLGSKNGLYVNGEKVQSRPLSSLDCLQIGAARIYYVLSEHAYFAAAGNPSSSSSSKTLTHPNAPSAQRLDADRLLEHVLHHLLRGALHLAQADRATLWMPDSTGDLIPRLSANENENAPSASHVAPAWQDQFASCQQLALKIFHSGSTILRENWQGTEMFWEGLRAHADFVYQQLGIPLRQMSDAPNERGMKPEAFASSAPLGALILESHAVPQRLSATKLARLQNFLELAGQFVSHAQFIASALQQLETGTAQHTSEAELALAIQQRLLPVTIPRIAGYDLACWHHPAEGVSGDYLDLVPLNTNELLLVIGDVAGKGMAAALLLSALQAGLRLQLYYESRLQKWLEALNRLVHAIGRASTFATLFLGVLDPQRRTLSYINAGHTPGVFIHSSNTTPTIELLHSNGAALGVLEAFTAEPKHLLLPSASALALFTDGITEAANENGEQYGLTRLTERVTAAVMSTRQTSAAHVLETLREDVALYSADFNGKIRRQDDQAALVVMVR